jgi:hypothetical protein
MHYPVVNRAGDIVAAAVTNLDLHDISRAAKTYGVKQFYVITPLADQKALVNRLIHHWVRGVGSQYNPKRGAALQLIRIADSLDEVVHHVWRNCGVEPKTVVTSAKTNSRNISFGKLREMMQNGTPHVLVFGTAWGLSESVLSAADFLLEPIRGNEAYNHLSVRSATAIVLDRLLGMNK